MYETSLILSTFAATHLMKTYDCLTSCFLIGDNRKHFFTSEVFCIHLKTKTVIIYVSITSQTVIDVLMMDCYE